MGYFSWAPSIISLKVSYNILSSYVIVYHRIINEACELLEINKRIKKLIIQKEEQCRVTKILFLCFICNWKKYCEILQKY